MMIEAIKTFQRNSTFSNRQRSTYSKPIFAFNEKDTVSKTNISIDNVNQSFHRSNSFRVKRNESGQPIPMTQRQSQLYLAAHSHNISQNYNNDSLTNTVERKLPRNVALQNREKQIGEISKVIKCPRNDQKDIENKENQVPFRQTLYSQLKNNNKKVIVKQKSLQIQQIEDEISIKKVDSIDLRSKLKFPPPRVTAKSWVVFEVSSCKMIWGQKCHNLREVASLTKIMTFVTAIKLCKLMNIRSNQTYLKVSKMALRQSGTTANLQLNSYISISDLFYGLMLPSGNDAAWVLAESLGALYFLYGKFDTTGLVQSFINDKDKKEQLSQLIESVNQPTNFFVNEMNVYGHEINITSSTWDNPHGLNNKYNKSSAYDIARLTCKAMSIQFFRKVVKTKKYTALVTNSDGTLLELSWQNTNKLIDEGWEGVKTGITPNAGPCLSACLTLNHLNQDYQFVVVVLNSQSMDHRWDECKQLVKWVSENQE